MTKKFACSSIFLLLLKPAIPCTRFHWRKKWGSSISDCNIIANNIYLCWRNSII